MSNDKFSRRSDPQPKYKAVPKNAAIEIPVGLLDEAVPGKSSPRRTPGPVADSSRISASKAKPRGRLVAGMVGAAIGAAVQKAFDKYNESRKTNGSTAD